jgi:hypothetical protein
MTQRRLALFVLAVFSLSLAADFSHAASSRDRRRGRRGVGSGGSHLDKLLKEKAKKAGRKSAEFTIRGIRPEVEDRALPGDELKDGPAVNNIHVNYRNADSKVWVGNGNFIYRVTKSGSRYKGFDKLRLRLTMTKPKAGSKKRKSFVTFDKPITMRICAKTKLDNCFWTETTVRVEGDDKKGYSLAGEPEIWLDRYSRRFGSDAPPLAYTFKEEQAKQRADREAKAEANRAKLAEMRARSKAKAEARAKAKAAPAPAPKPAAKAPSSAPAASKHKPMFVSKGAKRPAGKAGSGRLANRALKKAAARKGRRGRGAAPIAKGEVIVKGFSADLAGQLAKDPVKLKKNRFKVKFYFGNADGKWARIQGQSVRNGYDADTGTFRDFDLKIRVKESHRVSFDKPLKIRVEAVSQSKAVYWAEVERTQETLGEPIVITEYSPK